MKFFILLGVLCHVSCKVFAGIYHYHPSGPLALSKGYDPLNPFEATLPCLNESEVINLDTSGAYKTRFGLTIIKNREDLYRHLHISSKISAKYLFYNGGGNFNFDDEITFHSDSLTWIISAQTDYGRYALKNPELNDLATYLKNHNPKEFISRCGREVVLEERKGTLVAAMFSLKNLDHSHKQKIESSFRGGVSYGLFSGELNSSYQKFLEYALSVGKLHLHFYALGGEGIRALRPLVQRDPYDLNTVTSVIADYISGMGPENSVPFEYKTASFQKFGVNTDTDSLNIYHQEKTLTKLYHLYKNMYSTSLRLQSVLDNSELYGLNNQNYQKYSYQYSERNLALEKISSSAFKCQNDYQNCQVPSLDLSRIIWPKIHSASNQCEIKRLEAYRYNLINEETYFALRDTNQIPVYNRINDPTSGLVGIANCNL
jgi:hypothetical protein